MHVNNLHQLKYDAHKVLNHYSIFQKQNQLHQALLFHLYFEQFEVIKQLFDEHIPFMFLIELGIYSKNIFSKLILDENYFLEKILIFEVLLNMNMKLN